MNIQTNKLDLIKLILSIDNNDLIQKISNLVSTQSSDFWNELTISQQQDVLEGIDDLDNNRKISFESVLKKIS